MSSPAASLNTLIYKAILALILKSFKRFLSLHATYSVIEEFVKGFVEGFYMNSHSVVRKPGRFS
jgi:hypothetical protein